MKKKKVQLNVYVTPQFAEEIKQYAIHSDLSTSMYINLAIQTLVTIQETGKVPEITLNRLFREYPVINDMMHMDKIADEEK